MCLCVILYARVGGKCMKTCGYMCMKTCGYMCCWLVLWGTQKQMNVLCDMCEHMPKHMCMAGMYVRHVSWWPMFLCEDIYVSVCGGCRYMHGSICIGYTCVHTSV